MFSEHFALVQLVIEAFKTIKCSCSQNNKHINKRKLRKYCWQIQWIQRERFFEINIKWGEIQPKWIVFFLKVVAISFPQCVILLPYRVYLWLLCVCVLVRARVWMCLWDALYSAPPSRLWVWYDPRLSSASVWRANLNLVRKYRSSLLGTWTRTWKSAKLDPYIMTMYKGKRRNHRCKFTQHQ